MNGKLKFGQFVLYGVGSGTADFGNALQFAPVVKFHQLNMVARRKVETARRADFTANDVFTVVLADRAFRAGHVRHAQHHVIKFGLLGGQLFLLNLQLFANGFAFGDYGRTFFGRRGFNRVAEFVFFFGQSLRRGFQFRNIPVQGNQRIYVQRFFGITFFSQPVLNFFRVLGNIFNIQHFSSVPVYSF